MTAQSSEFLHSTMTPMILTSATSLKKTLLMTTGIPAQMFCKRESKRTSSVTMFTDSVSRAIKSAMCALQEQTQTLITSGTCRRICGIIKGARPQALSLTVLKSQDGITLRHGLPLARQITQAITRSQRLLTPQSQATATFTPLTLRSMITTTTMKSRRVGKTLTMNPNALLEFWGKSFDSFPKEIFREEVGYGNIRSLPHAVIFIFDGKRDKLVNKEDLLFYKKLIDISKNKGYKDVHVVLSRFDEFEKKILENNKGYNEGEILSEINKLKNIKIENVISLLGVNWSNVHFIENYHDDEQIENNATIDYNILKTLLDIINSAELFIIEKMSRTPGCYGLCSLK